ncbi:hypothetical protein HFP15_21290 [Amycolatopsis sp. K13G38]|uniref:Uncharacterized protein n=1 Tax=Amycolatopsis acididurans TaxID=2724524 RepID=A0ABX1J6K5_9PSEU|nr:hypothetical protein [Amycolatopsis acididurans]NKQ55422.1 hypothetical protein [Amycolatopsis acididurans]
MPSIEEQADWLNVARVANAWAGLTNEVCLQVTRDRDVGKVSYEEWRRVHDEMDRAWDVCSAEVNAAFALHSAQRQGVSLEMIVADLRRDQR